MTEYQPYEIRYDSKYNTFFANKYKSINPIVFFLSYEVFGSIRPLLSAQTIKHLYA